MEERRKGYANLMVIQERLNTFIDNTKQYRADLCDKIDYITQKIDSFPCKERSGWYKSMETRVTLTWGAIILTWAIFGAIVNLILKSI